MLILIGSSMQAKLRATTDTSSEIMIPGFEDLPPTIDGDFFAQQKVKNDNLGELAYENIE